jgi:hypothetical protein
VPTLKEASYQGSRRHRTTTVPLHGLLSLRDGEDVTHSLMLHVRGIGVGRGEYLSEDELQRVFSYWGKVVLVSVRRRTNRETGENTSWALVRMADADGFARVLNSRGYDKQLSVDSGRAIFIVNPFDPDQAKSSKGGGMKSALSKQDKHLHEVRIDITR